MPPRALADTLPGQGIRALEQLRARTQTAPITADMATEGQPQCQAMSTTMDALQARAQAALTTNDPGQMRTALNEVLQQQTAMQDRMAMCTHRMGMMQSMHSGMSGHR